MPSWDSSQYLQFANERAQPCLDLVARIALSSPQRIIDLGCGPGNSTAVLRARWPEVDLTGLDNSAEMLVTARSSDSRAKWLESDIADWSPDAPYDLIFSNAALHWVPDHGTLFPRLLRAVAPGGVLAVQMPGNHDAPVNQLMRELTVSQSWRMHFPRPINTWKAHSLPFYYDTLAPHASHVDLWVTEYLHILHDHAAMIEWYRGTGLRPYLDALPRDTLRTAFCTDLLAGVRHAYLAQPDGRVLFPFRRIFIVARR
ncbi:MAG: methyltransferase domain-containing protein [Opitutaceae bacterium]|nr:methyltransferase domain-containing protein [Opitutaceae bacterium]